MTTRIVFMGPLWFASIMAACGNALTWTSEQGAQNGHRPDSTRHTPRARAGASRRAREQQAGARESRRARGRAGARESRAGAGARYPVLGGDDFSATTWPSSPEIPKRRSQRLHMSCSRPASGAGGAHCPSVFVCVAHLSLEMTALLLFFYFFILPSPPPCRDALPAPVPLCP